MKGSPNFRFYALYDKVYREDLMAFAYECCKTNRGAASVVGQTFKDIERRGGCLETAMRLPCVVVRASAQLLLELILEGRRRSGLMRRPEADP
jgi:hypothetical protein